MAECWKEIGMRLATANLKSIGKLKLMVVIATTLCQESPTPHPTSMPGDCFHRRKWLALSKCFSFNSTLTWCFQESQLRLRSQIAYNQCQMIEPTLRTTITSQSKACWNVLDRQSVFPTYVLHILVGGDWNMFYDFPFSWECHHPN